jgi:hypothetical protein
LNPQPIQSLSMPHYTEKRGGSDITRCQLQICLGYIWQSNRWAPSVTWYFHSHPWDKPA